MKRQRDVKEMKVSVEDAWLERRLSGVWKVLELELKHRQLRSSPFGEPRFNGILPIRAPNIVFPCDSASRFYVIGFYKTNIYKLRIADIE